MRMHRLALTILTVALGPNTADAAFIVPDSLTPVFQDWSRFDAGSTYAEWDNFTSSHAGANAPDVSDLAGTTTPATGYSLVQHGAPGAVVLGSPAGNIYSPGGPSSFTVVSPGYGLGAASSIRVVVQLRTLGTDLDPSSVLLTAPGGSPVAPDYSVTTTAGSGFGASAEHLFAWDYTGSAAGFTVDFSSSGAHLSLDKVAIDAYAQVGSFTAFPVPEPAAVLLLAVTPAFSFVRRKT